MAGRGSTTLRVLVAAVVTSSSAVLATVFWLLARARYLEDYCFTRVTPPSGTGWRGPFFDGPITLRCDYDTAPAVRVTDPWPLLGAVILGLGVLMVAVFTIRWVRAARDVRPLVT